MEAGMRSDFLCCMTHQSWVRGVRPRSTPGDRRQPVLGVGLLPGSQLPSGPSPRYPAGLPGLLRAFPGWGQPGALGSCSRLTTVSHSPCFTMGEARLTPGLTSPPGGRRGCGKHSFQVLAYHVLQGCRWSGVGRQCPARPHSALTQEVQPVTGPKGRRRGVQKLRTRPSETFL